MRRGLGKAHVRVVGVDDGSFRREDTWAPVAAVAVAAPDRVESIRLGRVRVDGRDATEEVARLVRATGGLDGLRAVLLDGVVVGGFNVLDLDRLHRMVGVPVVAVTRRAPDFPAIHAALRRWFPRDAARRWGLLRQHRLYAVPSPGPRLLLTAVGCRRVDAVLLLRRTIVQGHVPEPLRLAHLVASAGAPGPRASGRTIKRPRAGPPRGL
ncbi:MAG: DUF99 family protein [Thermoplasmata archaeon]|nr:DUF99 family protein [Thermoplasmata archaeon]